MSFIGIRSALQQRAFELNGRRFRVAGRQRVDGGDRCAVAPWYVNAGTVSIVCVRCDEEGMVGAGVVLSGIWLCTSIN